MPSIQEKLLTIISDLPIIQTASIKPELDFATDSRFGDLSCNAAMQLFGNLTDEQKQELNIKSPRDLAQHLADQIQKKIEANSQLISTISEISVAGPGFINFTLSDQYLTQLPFHITSSKNFGNSNWGEDKKWEIEHTSPNPNKAMHLGHLRNNVTGMAIANLWQSQGIEVFRDAVDNNRGIAIARLMWGYLKFAHKENKTIIDLNYWFEHQDEWFTPQDKNLRPDKFVDELYLQASQDCKADSESEQKVRQMVVDWEKGEEQTWALWERVLSYSHQGQELTLNRLGNVWDKVWHEHEHYQKGKDLVDEGLKKGVFQKLPDGAILTDLEKYNLPDTIVQKADGTSLYITQDLALTKLKKESLQAEKLHWVVGPEQSLALKQLFAVCEQLGIAKLQNLTHLAYGYMSLKGEGKMSSRLGNVVYIDDLIDAVKAEVEQVMGQSKQEFTAQEQEEISEIVSLGAIKYSILKVGRMSDTAFDLETALRLDGNSGPYLQYTYTRARSVLAKADNKEAKYTSIDPQYSLNPEEKAVLRLLVRYPDIVTKAAKSNEPSGVANYLFELTQRFNGFYNKHQIIAEEQANQNFRLLLTSSVAQVIKHGLTLLGIDTPPKM